MKSKLIKFSVTALILTMVLSSAVFAYNPFDDSLAISPLWENTTRVVCEIYFDNGKGIVDVSVDGDAGTTVVITATLYRKANGIMHFVESWNNDDLLGYSSAMLGEEFEPISGETYVLLLDAVVTLNGYDERLSFSDTEVAP